MSTIRANTLVNMDGVTAVTLTGQVAAKSWINLGGGSATTAGYTYGSFNVSSVTTNGMGDYTVSFSRSMADAYYAAQVTGNFFSSTGVASFGAFGGQPGYFQTGSIRVGHQQAASFTTFTYMSVTVHR